MKSTKTILSLAVILIAGLFFISSCSGNKPVQEDKTTETEIKKECPMDDPNVLEIVATLTIKNEADKNALVKALHAVVDGTRTEEGNISYILHQDINNPMVYVIIEVWKSQEAINTHNETPHFKAFKEAVGGKADLTVNTIRKVY